MRRRHLGEGVSDNVTTYNCEDGKNAGRTAPLNLEVGEIGIGTRRRPSCVTAGEWVGRHAEQDHRGRVLWHTAGIDPPEQI